MSTEDRGLEKPEVTEEIEHVPNVDTYDEDDFPWSATVCINLAALYMTYFSCVWAQISSASALAFIMKAFPAGAASAAWIVGVMSLFICVVSIFIGDLSDMFGRRYFLMFATLCGVVGMLVSSRANSVPVIIGGQTLTSLALSIGYLTTPLVAEIVPKRSRSPVIAITTFLAGLISLAGSIGLGACMQYNVGGLNQGWRIGFYLGVGFWAISFVLLTIFYHPADRPNPENLSAKTRLLKVDWVGIVIASAGITLILVGLQLGGSTYPWSSPVVIALIAIGGVLIFIFSIWEWKFAKNQLIPASLFQHRNYAIGLAINFIEGMVALGAQAFLNVIVVNLLQSDYLLATVYGMPSAGGTIAGAALTAYVVYKTREVRGLAIFGCIILTIGVGTLAILQPHINLAAYFIPTILTGIAVGIFAVLNPVIATVCTPNEYVATSVSVGTSIRGLGGSIALVMVSTIFENKLGAILLDRIMAAVVMAGLPTTSLEQFLVAYGSGDTAAFAQVPGFSAAVGAALTASVSQAYADSFRYIWYSLIPFCILTLIASWFLQSTKTQITQEVVTAVESRHHHKDGTDDVKEMEMGAV